MTRVAGRFVLVVLLALAAGTAARELRLPGILQGVENVVKSGVKTAVGAVENGVKTAVNKVENVAQQAKTALVGNNGPTAQAWPASKGPKPVCLFVHGTGPDMFPTQVVSTFTAYWGNIHQNVAPACTPQFLQVNQNTYGWDDSFLWNAICNAIKSTNAQIVISHSNGNIALSAAIFKGVDGCANRVYSGAGPVPKGKFLWFSLAGPFLGSPAADLCISDCPTFTLSPLPAATKLVCHCTNKKAIPSEAKLATTYKSKVAGFTSGWAAVSSPHSKAFAVMCGTSTAAVAALKEDNGLVLLAPQANWNGQKTDGMVSLPACQAGLPAAIISSFSSQPSAKFFLLDGNHGSSTFRDGNGNAPAQQPITWLINNLQAATALLSA